MNKNEKQTEKTTTNTTENKEAVQIKLGVFEEDDYFEEFDDEGRTIFIFRVESGSWKRRC